MVKSSGSGAGIEPQAANNIEPSDYCGLLFRKPDRLRIINAHPDVVETVEAALKGQKELHFTKYFKSKVTCAFKIAGSPFNEEACSQEAQVLVHRVVGEVIANLQKKNWNLVTSSDLGRENTQSCLFFRKLIFVDRMVRQKYYGSGQLFSILPMDTDRLVMIDAPSKLETEVHKYISHNWGLKHYEILEEGEGNKYRTSKFRLKGSPWLEGGTADDVADCTADTEAACSIKAGL